MYCMGYTRYYTHTYVFRQDPYRLNLPNTTGTNCNDEPHHATMHDNVVDDLLIYSQF